MTNEVKNVPELRFSDFSEEWEDNLVGSLFEFKNGLNKGKEHFGYGLPIVNFKDVFHNRGIKGEYLNGKVNVSEKELQNYSVRKGDVFFTRTSEIIEEIGYPAVMMDEIPKAVFSGFVLRARPKKNIKLVDDKFKRYVFFTYSFRKEMITKSSITTRALTSGTAINKMKVVYPTSIEEQNKIGDFFSKLDRQIELEEQKLSLLEEQKKGYMQKIFSQELRFKDENGNDYPEWEIKKLMQIAKVKTGSKNVQDNIQDGKYKFFDRSVEVKYLNTFDFDETAIIYPGEGSKFLPRYFSGKYSLHQRAYSIYDININNNYLYYYLSLQNNHFLKYAVGSTVKSLRMSGFDKLKVMVPKNSEQEKIGSFFKNLDEFIEKQANKVELLKQRKQSFLQKLFV